MHLTTKQYITNIGSWMRSKNHIGFIQDFFQITMIITINKLGLSCAKLRAQFNSKLAGQYLMAKLVKLSSKIGNKLILTADTSYFGLRLG